MLERNVNMKKELRQDKMRSKFKDLKGKDGHHGMK